MTRYSSGSLRRQKPVGARGNVRVEVAVPPEDADLIGSIATALADPGRRVQARILLRKHFDDGATERLKELLAAAPLDGIDLERPRDQEQDVVREIDW